LVSFAFLLFVAPAHGQVDTPNLPKKESEGTSEASRAFWNGKEFYESGQFIQAQDQFLRAYHLTNDPDLLYDIGQTYRKMGQCELALSSYQDFLRLAPASPLVARAEKQVSNLKASCLSSPKAATSPALPNDKPHSEFPAQLALGPERNPASPQSATRIANDQPGLYRRIRVWSYVTLAVGVAAGGAATALELWNDHRYGDWSQRNRNLATGLAPGETGSGWLARQQDNDQLGNSIQRVDREVLFSSLGAGALLATSAVLFLASTTQSPKANATPTHRSDVALHPVVLGTKLVSLSVVGSF
jgi:tetratricopeptide (TPR) repeat protein